MNYGSRKFQMFVVKVTAIALLALSLLVLFDFVDDAFFDASVPLVFPTLVGISTYISDVTVTTLSTLGYTGIFTLMFLEATSLPIPSEVILPFSGYLVSIGKLDFWITVLVSTLASILGAMVDYSIGYFLGVRFLNGTRRSRGSIVDLGQLQKVEIMFERYGGFIVFVTRMMPGIRTLASFPAGATRMNITRFVVYTGLGSGILNAVLVFTGDYLGAHWNAIGSTGTVGLAVVVAVVIVAGWAIIRRRRGIGSLEGDL